MDAALAGHTQTGASRQRMWTDIGLGRHITPESKTNGMQRTVPRQSARSSTVDGQYAFEGLMNA